MGCIVVADVGLIVADPVFGPECPVGSQRVRSEGGKAERVHAVMLRLEIASSFC